MTEATIDLDKGLAAHYRLDGNADDALGASNGTLIGGRPVADRLGTPAGALEFDGVDDYVEIPHTEALSVAADFSIATWILHQPQALHDAWHTLFEKSDPERGGHSRYGMWIRADRISLCYEAADHSMQPYGEAPVPLPYDEWHHVAAVRDASRAVLYVDGEVVGEVVVGRLRVSQSPFSAFIGTDTYGEGELFFAGSLDDLRVYSRALNEAEVQALAAGRD